MTEPTTPGVSAGELLADMIRSMSVLELEMLRHTGRHHRDVSREDPQLPMLAEFWNVLAIAGDTVISEHPNLLPDLEHIELYLSDDTPTDPDPAA